MVYFKRMLARVGVSMISLAEWLRGYGLYLVFRHGSESLAEGYIRQAVEARQTQRPQLILVPVMTDAEGVPAAPVEGGNGNDYIN